MSPPGFVRMPEAEVEGMLTRAAQESAGCALVDVGLEGHEAALDLRDLRALLDCLRFVHRTLVQTAVRISSARPGMHLR